MGPLQDSTCLLEDGSPPMEIEFVSSQTHITNVGGLSTCQRIRWTWQTHPSCMQSDVHQTGVVMASEIPFLLA